MQPQTLGTPDLSRGITRATLVIGILLAFVPGALIAAALKLPPGVQFVLSLGAVIPLASLIGSATEALAERLGARIGGLLNATFGNAPDLLIGVFGVQKGLIPLVKATLVGALISNSALIMGLCYLIAGLIYGKTTFNREEAGHHGVLMMLTAAAILFPSVGVLAGGIPASTTTHVSVAISVVLLLVYFAYVAYSIFGWSQVRGRAVAPIEAPGGPDTATAAGWPLWVSIAVLLGATVALVPITDILTGSVQPVGRALGWTDVFVGMVVVANAGNVAEAYAAIKFAWQGAPSPRGAGGETTGMDLSLGIASASSIQIATFVAPVVVLYSQFAHPMSLVFSPVEIAILGLLAFIFAFIAHDGESNWLEGAQLLALYAMAAILFYALPMTSFGG